MAQPRVEDAFVGTGTAGEILGIPPSNVAKTFGRGFRPETREVSVLVDERGRVVAQKIVLGERPMWGFRRDALEKVKERKNGKKRAA